MYAWTKPEILIPVHGEAAHLNAQARLGGEAGIPQVLPIRNGDLVKLAPGLAEIIDQVPFGRIYKDGNIMSFDDALYKAAMSALSGIPKKRRKDDNMIRDAVSRAIRSETRNLWGKKPMTTVFVARV